MALSVPSNVGTLRVRRYQISCTKQRHPVVPSTEADVLSPFGPLRLRYVFARRVAMNILEKLLKSIGAPVYITALELSAPIAR